MVFPTDKLLDRLLSKAERRLLLRFVLVGLVNTAVGLGIIYACKYFLDMRDVPANMLGYAAGLCISFMLNSSWTFSYQGSRRRAVARFAVAFAISWLLNLAVVVIAIHLGLDDYLAHALGMPVYTACFFLLSRLYVFR